MNETIHSVEQILADAVAIASPEDRQAFVAQACADNAELRAQVERLLANHDRAGDFLERPAAIVETVAPPAEFERPGTQIGPYKLLEQIGEGGMGLVFMAEQTVPVKRMVALKLVKPGMDSRQVIARFEAERQALALMDHPNIAKVLDAGSSESGRPYFVMELVRGIPITDYCDQARSPIRQRLELFMKVCQAVQHAHTKGIIHRDLKPTNVLVTSHDGVPVPMVIDFGVAKATGQRLTERTLFTHFAQMIGTPTYMSPEQAEMNALDVDTRSDIYSLGVLLYELLTGTTPFDKEKLSKLGYDEMRRVIREDEPPRPSERINTLGAEASSTVSERRGVDARRLGQSLRGELDWIAMKALEKDRNRRYETANGFAMDVQRYLKDEQVLVCPPSAGYRVRKFVRRNKGPVLAALLVLLALLLGLGGTTWSMIRANTVANEKENALAAAVDEAKQKEKARAESAANALKAKQAAENERLAKIVAEAARDRAVNTLEAMTSGIVGDVLAQQQVVTAEQRAFLSAALEYFRETLKENETDPATLARIAKAAFRIGSIEFRLDRKHEAIAMFQQARELHARLISQAPDNVEHRLRLVNSSIHLGSALYVVGEISQAEKELHNAIDLAKKLAAGFPQEPECRFVLAGCRNNLSNVLIDLGKLEDAEIELRMALDLFAELAAEFPHRTEYHDSLAGSRMSLGALLIDLGKLGQGADELSVAINLYEKLATEFPTVAAHRSGLAASHYNLGIALRGLGKLAQAQREYRTALAIETKLVAEFPAAPKYRQSLAKTHSELALLFADMLGKRQEAEAECRAAHTIYQNLAIEFPGVPQYRLNLAGTHHSLGKVLFLLGKPEQAEAEYRTAFDIQAKLTKDYPAVTDHALGLAILIQDHGEQLVHHGRIAEGLPKLRQAASIWKGLAERSKEHPGYREMWAGALAYIAVCEAHSRNPQAEKTFQEAIELLKPLVADSPPTRPGHPSISALKAKAQSLGLVTGGVQPNPRNRLVSLYSNYANFLGEKMRFGEAVTAYVHALKLMPEHFAPLNGLAWLRAACPDAKYRNPGEAVELASKAVKAAPQVGGCWNTLGVAHYRQGDWKAAIEALNTSMELHPTKGDANDWFFLAMAHWQLGEKTKARSFHDRAVQWMVKHAPKDEELRRFRAEAEEVLGIKKDRP